MLKIPMDLEGIRKYVQIQSAPFYLWQEESGAMVILASKFLKGEPLTEAGQWTIRWYIYQFCAFMPTQPPFMEESLSWDMHKLNSYYLDVLLPMGIDPF